MTTRLVVVGAGGFGRETLDVIQAINMSPMESKFEIVGVIDDSPSPANLERVEARRFRYLGTIAEWLATGDRANYSVGIGSPDARKTVARLFELARLDAATLVHPTAVIGSAVQIGEGATICAGVQVSTNVRIGRHAHLNASATVGHDTCLMDFVSVNPAATVSGECTIGSQVLIGAGSVTLQGLVVGDGAVVGAGACVVRDVNPQTVVKGVPAR